MRYYRCECGDITSWSSMGVLPCDGCKKCNTTLETGPKDHKVPEDHVFEPYPVETDEGPKSLSRCKYCLRTKKELEKEL
jgi:hypothetical protein